MNLWAVTKQSFKEWRDDRASRLAAALSYYTIFSIAPLLVIVVAVVGLVYSQQAAINRIHNQISSALSPAAGNMVVTMIQNAQNRGSSIWATIIGTVILLIGATGAFAALQDALNTIWNVRADPNRGIWGMVGDRLLSFALVLFVGILLIASFLLSTALVAIGSFFQGVVPFASSATTYEIINFFASIVVITFLIAIIYKYLPDVEIDWKDVWIGSFVTAVLFAIGKLLFGLYLGHSSATSVYGAAGSLVAILLFIYYSSLILFFGAEFTQVYARRHGEAITPARGAIRLTDEERAQQGMTSDHKNAQPAQQGVQGGRQHQGAMAAVPVTGHPNQDQENLQTTPHLPQYPSGRPPMPRPVRLFTTLAGALLGTLGLMGVVSSFTSHPNVKKLQLENHQVKQEADHLRQIAQRMQQEGSHMETTASLMGSFSSELQGQGKRIENAVEKIKKQADKGIS